jgi:D-cysteine desulfhydrase
MPRGGATAVGAVGYVLAARELFEQLTDLAPGPGCVVVAVGSGGTMAGLIAGNALLGWPWRIVGASVSRPPEEISGRVVKLARECLLLLAGRVQPGCRAELVADTVTESRVELIDARGPGHGVASEAGRNAADMALRAEGMAVDPVYTAKALAVLGATGERAAVFWHTGGLLDVLTQIPGMK